MSLKIALQLYSVREDTGKDFIGTLEKVAGIGYEGVEFAGYGGIEATQMKKHLDRLGLKAVSSHVGLDALKNDIDSLIKYSLEIGSRYIVCAWAPLDKLEEIKSHAELFNRIGKRCKDSGIVFGYHNHSHEFVKIDGEYAMDILCRLTDPDLVKVQFDTCWIYAAGADPVHFIRTYAKRCPMVHIKDLKNIDKKELTEIGNGIVDIRPIVDEARKIGMEWLIVEQDTCERPPLESARINYENLRKLVV